MICQHCQSEYEEGVATTSQFCQPACEAAAKTKQKNNIAAIARWEQHYLKQGQVCQGCQATYDPQALGATIKQCATCSTIPASVEALGSERTTFQKKITELEQTAEAFQQQLKQYTHKFYLDLETLLQKDFATETSVQSLITTLQSFSNQLNTSFQTSQASQGESQQAIAKAISELPVETLHQTVVALEHKFLDLTAEVKTQATQITDKTVDQLVVIGAQLEALKELRNLETLLKQVAMHTDTKPEFEKLLAVFDTLPSVFGTYHEKLKETLIAFSMAQGEASKQHLKGLSDQMIRSYTVLSEAIRTSSITVSNLQDPHGVKINQTAPNFYTAGRPFDTAIAYHPSLTSDAEYVGIAEAGTAQSAASWQIKKIYYVSAGLPSGVVYANGSIAFNSIWTSREGLAYS